jgi:hypothetical protein
MWAGKLVASNIILPLIVDVGRALGLVNNKSIATI